MEWKLEHGSRAALLGNRSLFRAVRRPERKDEKMVIRLIRSHLILACCGILGAVVVVTMVGNSVRTVAAAPAGQSSLSASALSSSAGTAAQMLPSSSQGTAAGNEMRAVWVPYLSLTMTGENDRSEQAFRQKFSAVVQTAKSCKMNTVIVQVRPFGDALYSSSYFPWSHLLSGTQGKNPGYDPLKDMVEISHSAGLKIQAWVNPLRIKTSGTPQNLSTNNPYYKFHNDTGKSDYVAEFNGGIYYNPAYADVRALVADGVGEIVKNYSVDGIQFDDYFYPTKDAAFDQRAYQNYCDSAQKSGTPLPLDEWRRANISEMVAQVYRAVKAAKKNVPFGIAPQGNVNNDMEMGADVYAWCSTRGYIDYICPQLYYNFQNPTLPFDRAADTWCDLVKNRDIKLYFGLAAYKAASNADSGTWKDSSAILAAEVQYGRTRKCDGFMFYSCDYLTGDQTKREIQNVIKLLN